MKRVRDDSASTSEAGDETVVEEVNEGTPCHERCSRCAGFGDKYVRGLLLSNHEHMVVTSSSKDIFRRRQRIALNTCLTCVEMGMQDDSADRVRGPNVSQSAGLPSTSFAERAQYIPLRLSQDERKLLRLLESALNVSEYTDKVGMGRGPQRSEHESLINKLYGGIWLELGRGHCAAVCA